MKKRIEVVCGLFFREHAGIFEVALFRRLDYGGFFEFPGGKIDPGETPEQALVRELHEELNLSVEVLSFLGESEHEYEAAHILLKAYWVRPTSWQGLRLLDHSEYLWGAADWSGAPAELAPADRPLWRMIFEEGARPS